MKNWNKNINKFIIFTKDHKTSTLSTIVWIAIIIKLILNSSDYIEIALAGLIIEIALNINNFQKILVKYKPGGDLGLTLEKVRNEIYTQVIEEFSEVLAYLLTKTGKLASESRADELMSFRDKLLEILNGSKASDEIKKRINNILIKEVTADYQFHILSLIRQLYLNVYSSHKIQLSEMAKRVQHLMNKGEIDKIIPLIKDNISMQNIDVELEPIEKLLLDYSQFLKKY